MSGQIPLNYEASAGQTNLQVSSQLPNEVVQCLKNARFLHLATCTELQPHVSLMNYTYLPSTPYSSSPTIVMTTNPSSRKTHNLVSNPNVSLLVHDWVSHRPPPAATTSGAQAADTSAPVGGDRGARSSLATLLANLNSSAISSISATINGVARVVEQGTEEEKYLREKHLENNTFTDKEGESGIWRQGETSDGGRGCFIEGEEVRVVVVQITDGRVADWKGAVRDWSLTAPGQNGAGQPLTNGV